MFEPGDVVYYLSVDADYRFHLLEFTVIKRDLDKYEVATQFGSIYVHENELYETPAEAIASRREILNDEIDWLEIQLRDLSELENEI